MDSNGPEFSTPTTAVKYYTLMMKMPRYAISSRRNRPADAALKEYRVANLQWAESQESEWTTLATNVPAFSVPTASDLAPQTLLPADFPEYCLVEGSSVALCLDRSGSMSGNAIRQAKVSAKSVVSALDSGSHASVTSFQSSASIDHALTELSDTNRDSLHVAIDDLSASGSTNIGGGLLAAQGTLAGGGEKVKSIILLSDGAHNTGTNPRSVLNGLKADNISVYTVAFGSPDIALLSEIAAETGGKLIVTSGAGDLGRRFMDMLAEIKGGGNAMETEEFELRVGRKVTEIAEVTPGATQAVFSAIFDPGDIRFRVISPDREVHDHNSPFYFDNGGQKLFKVPDPAAGKWRVEVLRTRDARGGKWRSRGRVDIRDNQTATSMIDVPSVAFVNGLRVYVDVRHTYVGDLVLTLISPSGTRVVLHNATGGSDDDIKGTYGVDLTASDSLSQLDGEVLTGTWTLEVRDNYSGDEGRLQSWSLESQPSFASTTEDVALDAYVEDSEIFVRTDMAFDEVVFPRTHAGFCECRGR